MANPMSASEAWEVVKLHADIEWPSVDDEAQYARACAIVEALVGFHEARCMEWDSPQAGGSKAINKWYQVRALERGEGASK